jgi:hypothetical protein
VRIRWHGRPLQPQYKNDQTQSGQYTPFDHALKLRFIGKALFFESCSGCPRAICRIWNIMDLNILAISYRTPVSLRG